MERWGSACAIDTGTPIVFVHYLLISSQTIERSLRLSHCRFSFQGYSIVCVLEIQLKGCLQTFRQKMSTSRLNCPERSRIRMYCLRVVSESMLKSLVSCTPISYQYVVWSHSTSVTLISQNIFTVTRRFIWYIFVSVHFSNHYSSNFSQRLDTRKPEVFFYNHIIHRHPHIHFPLNQLSTNWTLVDWCSNCIQPNQTGSTFLYTDSSIPYCQSQ